MIIQIIAVEEPLIRRIVLWHLGVDSKAWCEDRRVLLNGSDCFLVRIVKHGKNGDKVRQLMIARRTRLSNFDSLFNQLLDINPPRAHYHDVGKKNVLLHHTLFWTQ